MTTVELLEVVKEGVPEAVSKIVHTKWKTGNAPVDPDDDTQTAGPTRIESISVKHPSDSDYGRYGVDYLLLTIDNGELVLQIHWPEYPLQTYSKPLSEDNTIPNVIEIIRLTLGFAGRN